jgi:predicted  nucleic acid-binding Zn-ribbon protein
LQKKLKLLDELQEIDLKLDGLQGAKALLLDEIAALESRVTEASALIAEKQAEAVTLEDEKKVLEESLSSEMDNIVRSEARLKEIKTQKEYQAVSKEISSARKLTVELEDQILQKVGRLEELGGDIAARIENLRELGANTAQQKEEVQAKIDELEADLATGAAASEAAMKGLPASIAKRYAILRKQRRGLAVVEAKDGYCLGCNMNLPPQLYNTLFRADEVITCPHCQRMLVLRQG